MNARSRRALVARCAAAGLLAWPGAAIAHVVPQPSFLEAGRTATIALAGPNERDEAMTGFRVRVPADLRIVGVHGPDGWSAEAGEQEATWSGGSLAPAREATFHVELEAPSAPGPATLETQQLYAGGEVVSWSVALTVVPAAEDPGTGLGPALAVAAALALVTAGIVAGALLLRRRTLQER